MARVVLISSEFPNGRMELRFDQLPAVMGRSNKCQVTINDPLLSRKHSEIRLNADGHPEIHDLDSTNLTIVNEHDVVSHVLKTGDQILLGDTEILVEVILTVDDPNEKTTRDLTLLPDPADETVGD